MVERFVYTEDVGSSTLSSRTINAPVTELVYVLVLETKFWEFESLQAHQFKRKVHESATQLDGISMAF